MLRRAYTTTLMMSTAALFFLAKIVRRLVACPIFDSPSVNSRSFILFFGPFSEAGFTSHACGRLFAVPSHAVKFHFAE